MLLLSADATDVSVLSVLTSTTVTPIMLVHYLYKLPYIAILRNSYWGLLWATSTKFVLALTIIQPHVNTNCDSSNHGVLAFNKIRNLKQQQAPKLEQIGGDLCQQMLRNKKKIIQIRLIYQVSFVYICRRCFPSGVVDSRRMPCLTFLIFLERDTHRTETKLTRILLGSFCR